MYTWCLIDELIIINDQDTFLQRLMYSNGSSSLQNKIILLFSEAVKINTCCTLTESNVVLNMKTNYRDILY